MTIGQKIGVKVFVVGFYRANASLFFLVIAFAGGFMRSHDHMALGEFFVAAPYLAIIPVTIWTAYCLFAMDFNLKSLKAGDTNFLSCFPMFSPMFQWSFSTRIICYQLLPVVAYAIFLIALALKNSSLITGAFIFLIVTGLIFLCAYALRRALHSTNEIATPITSRLGLNRFAKAYQAIVIHAVISRRFFAVIGYKIASLALLWGTLLLYSTDSYDLRLIGLACTIAFAFCISFVYEWHDLESGQFNLLRRMPLSMIQRLGYTWSIVITICLPEIILLLKNFPPAFSMVSVVEIVTYGISIVFLWYAFLFTRHRKFETVVAYISITTIVYFLLVLASVPLWILLLSNVLAGSFLYFRYYDTFELQAGERDKPLA